MRTARLSGAARHMSSLVLPEPIIREAVDQEIARIRGRSDRARRYRNRAQHHGADTGRRQLSEWNVGKGDADTSMLGDLATLRDHSRELERNSAIGKGILSTKLLNVVGSGFTLIPEPNTDVVRMSPQQLEAFQQQVSAEWDLFSTYECDVERVSSFAQLSQLAYLSQKRDGDCFALLPMLSRPGSPYATRVQLLEGDRVSNPDHMVDTEEISGGVRRNPVTGQVMGYYLTDVHPDSAARVGTVSSWRYVPAFGRKTGVPNMLHMFNKRRIGQSRGLPDLTPVIETLRMISKISEAELMATVLSSMFTVFIESEMGDQTLAPGTPTDEIGGSTADEDYKLGIGAIVGLAEGEKISTATPGRPNGQLDPYFTMMLREIGMGINIPFEILIKHFKSSYSASRAAMLEAWRYFSSERVEFTADFAQPIYERFFFEGVARGRISAPGFETGDPLIMRAYTRARWIGPPRGMIDEKAEMEASTLRVEQGYSTKEAETASLVGGSWRSNMRKRAQEEELVEELGLAPPEPSAPALPPGGGDEPPDDEGDDENG